MNKEKLIVLIGPTAVGKTKTSIELAKAFDGEIISGDSMQIYRGMDIGTAKIRHDEMEGIPHHLIDIKDPVESYSAAEFQQSVRKLITEIHARGKMPIIAGGTGLYIQSVLYDYRFTETPGDEAFRERLEEESHQIGHEAMHRKLADVDHEAASQIHPNNIRRVIRALEIHHTTGKTMTEYQKQQSRDLQYDVALIGLTMDRDKLYERINLRVDMMVDEGLLHEVRSLYEDGVREVQSVGGMGSHELFDKLEGKVRLGAAGGTW